jgi:hypothetical protein
MTAATTWVMVGLAASCFAGGSLLIALLLERSEVPPPMAPVETRHEERAPEVPTVRIQAEGLEPAGGWIAQRPNAENRLVTLGSVAGSVAGHEGARLDVVATPTGAGLEAPGAETARSMHRVRVAADGSFVLARLEPGTWRLAALPRSAFAERFTSPRRIGEAELAHAEVLVVPGACTDTTLRVKPGGRIEGRVRVTGEPGTRMSVRAQPLSPLDDALAEVPGTDTPRRPMRPRQTSTDPEGAFVIAGLPAGYYLLSVASEGLVHRPLWVERVRVDVGVRRRCDVTLRLQEVCVEVADAAGAPVQGVELLLVGRREMYGAAGDTALRRRTVTDSQGKGSFLRITAGQYSVSGRCDAPALTVEPCETKVDMRPVTLRLLAQPRRQ